MVCNGRPTEDWQKSFLKMKRIASLLSSRSAVLDRSSLRISVSILSSFTNDNKVSKNHLMESTEFIHGKRKGQTWNTVKKLQLVSQTVSVEAGSKSKRLCRFLETHGYSLTEVSDSWEDLLRYSICEIRWATHNLQAERKKLTVDNLFVVLKEPNSLGTNVRLSVNPSGQECIETLSMLLGDLGASLESTTELKEKLISNSKVEKLTIKNCLHAMDVARILVRYLCVMPDSVIAEFSCLSYLHVGVVVDGIPDIKRLGLNLPGEVVNYLTGIYLTPGRRALKSCKTIDVLNLLGLSQEEANKRNFTRHLINYIISIHDINDIKNMFDFLVDNGYSRNALASVPYIFAFSLHQFTSALEATPELESLENTGDKLQTVFKELDKRNGSKVTKLYIQRKRIRALSELQTT